MANGQVIYPSLAGSGPVAANKQPDGTALTWVAAATHSFSNDGNLFLQVKTGAGGNQTMTVTTHVPPNRGLVLPDRTIDLTANTTKLYGPFPTDMHNDEDGNIQVAFSNITGLEVTAFSVPSV